MKLFGRNKKTEFEKTKEYLNSIPEHQREMAAAALGLGLSRNQTRTILDVVKDEQIDRISFGIRDWRVALDCAESAYNPDRYELTRLFKDVIDDYRVSSGMQTRTHLVSLSKFVLKNADDSINEEATKKLNNYHTYTFIRETVKSLFYGYSLIQILYDKNELTGVKAVPFENTAPELKAVKVNSAYGVFADNLIYLDGSVYDDSLVEVFQCRKDLGLLNKTIPFYVWKKVFGAWSQHAELFGMDTRIIKTDINDNARRQSAVNMLKGMVRAAWGVFDLEDEFETVGTKADAFNIYEKLIEKCDQAISIILLGQTGTTDEKSYVGSADVHQQILENYTKSDKIFVGHIIQNKYLKVLERIGYIPTGLTFEWDDAKEITYLEKVTVVKDLAPHFTFTAEFIENYLGLEVEPKQSPSDQVFENVAKLYMNDGENI